MSEPSCRVLYVITCATPADREVGKLVALAQERGWQVCVIATPSALAFLDQAALEEQVFRCATSTRNRAPRTCYFRPTP